MLVRGKIMGLADLARISHRYLLGVSVGLFGVVAGFGPGAVAQTSPATEAQSGQQQGSDNPVLTQRPAQTPKSLVIPEGKIKLDVVVDDGAGKPVLGLQPWDFKILDNNEPRKVMSFSAFSDAGVRPDPPVEIILVTDTLNLPFQQVAFVRGEIGEFLRQNGGKLKQPLTLVLLSDAGIRFQPRPSTDGNAIASVVEGIKGSVSMINPAMGGGGYVERFQRSAKAMDNIAQNEARKPGRKLLIWVGPGWPMLSRHADGYSEKEQRRNFANIIELTTALREARITAYSVAPGSGATPNALFYRTFLNPVKTYRDADFGNLALKVLVTQTGGRILGPDNDLAGQINRCVEDAGAFYRVSFDPPAAERSDEYHELKFVVDKPGAIVRTNSGYYNEPAGH
jgi:VWFA-related protein